jgi:Mycothiol maleylpyruvate isomerase N-terminal domain
MSICEECGFASDTDLASAVRFVAEFPLVATELLADVSDRLLRTRPHPQVWSALEYAAHTGEALSWYHDRIRRIMSEQEPQLTGFDWDVATDEARYHNRSTSQVLNEVSISCTQLAEDLARLRPSDWRRFGWGSDGSPRSIAELTTRAAHEAVHHAYDICVVLGDV